MFTGVWNQNMHGFIQAFCGFERTCTIAENIANDRETNSKFEKWIFTPLWSSASSHVECCYPFLAVAAASLASQGTVSLCFVVTLVRSSDHDDFCPLFCNLLACKLLKEHNSCQKWLISDRSFRKCEQNRIKSFNAIASKHQVSWLRNNVNRDPGIALGVNMSSCDWLTS